MRDVILEHNFSADDILHKLKMRIWDQPLTFDILQEKLRLLDPTLTVIQIKNIGKLLKNSQNLIEVPTLMRNLTGDFYSNYLILNLFTQITGKEFETVDYTQKVFKEMYSTIKNTNSFERIKELFEVISSFC
jgi:hypothetical protein